MNAEGLMQKVSRLIDPTGQSVPDWMILKNLALTMGRDLGVRNLAAIQDEIAKAMVEEPPARAVRAFHPVEYTPGKDPDRDHPLRLVIRDVLQHSGSMSTSSRSLDLVVSEALLEINDEDAQKQGIADSSHVRLTSRQGSVFLKASVTEDVPRGTVFVPTHFPYARINMLTTVSGNGEAPITAVRVEAAG